MGRRKIESLKSRYVCFSKRRQGLFKKAGKLSRLCDVDVAIFAFSSAGNPFVFGNNSELVFQRYLHGHGRPSSFAFPIEINQNASINVLNRHGGRVWDVEDMSVGQLHDCLRASEDAKSNVTNRLQLHEEFRRTIFPCNESGVDSLEEMTTTIGSSACVGSSEEMTSTELDAWISELFCDDQ